MIANAAQRFMMNLMIFCISSQDNNV